MPEPRVTETEHLVMGRNIPKGRIKQLHYFEAHVDAWKDDPAAIGLTPAQVADLETEITEARSMFSDLIEARNNARALTRSFHAQSDALHIAGSGLITIIKGFAMSSANPAAILLAAKVFLPNAPGPGDPPERPVVRNFVLTAMGGIELQWKARGPGGTTYLVSRKLPGETAPTVLGAGTKKRFTDNTIPPGTISATYYVQAIRGSSVSEMSVGSTIPFSSGPQQRAKSGAPDSVAQKAA